MFSWGMMVYKYPLIYNSAFTCKTNLMNCFKAAIPIPIYPIIQGLRMIFFGC